jgi:N-acetylmuramoyl-L-alanine amidase
MLGCQGSSQSSDAAVVEPPQVPEVRWYGHRDPWVITPALAERPILCLDPGHGGEDPGAVGPSGLRECDVVLDICELMKPALELLGWRVNLTRKADVFVGLSRRAAIANGINAALFVSMHANAFHRPEAHGFEVWTSPGDTGDADRVATNIYRAIENTFPYATGRPDLGDGDPDKEGRFTVLTKTKMGAVLVESAFISNELEESRLADPGWRMRFAGACVSGIGPASPWRAPDRAERVQW